MPVDRQRRRGAFRVQYGPSAASGKSGWFVDGLDPREASVPFGVEAVHAADYQGAVARIAELEALVKAAPDYLGARQALHNHWIDEAAKVVGELGGSLPVEGLR